MKILRVLSCRRRAGGQKEEKIKGRAERQSKERMRADWVGVTGGNRPIGEVT